ncbi:glycoside hydrolase family 32 protein [Flavobacterium franklandianum]|uniref:Glycoside hydrolase family 32 protein n=1 Tax=Flavobacterium franklandianum TaxID=2594430 RepID=A0A553CU41_9FLAO|nr:glycoside hydrolase family 32 protein [Flavobacterium franklandianum]TRX24036.1 glycoside hydrolase family 32 protein [Flavobacterium franklandianum]TRX25371.1 glycoside hydrolase family 32 protein [Flavobacterium franklandianum]
MKIDKKITFLFLLIAFFFSVYTNGQNLNYPVISNGKMVADSTRIYAEPFRPQFHFSPEKKWMNDPNGLVFYKGIYHLFYQYYPEDIVWGPMHWGHATSTDLIHWKHHKIALFPDKLGYIFSGSVVIDVNNSSGLGTLKNPAMVAIFTYHNMDSEKAGKINTQSQALAYSLDEGETWSKYQGNPIIANLGLKDFRDPNVFWNTETNTWNLLLVAGDYAQVYTSENLINWKLESEFGKGIGAHGGVWECPNLFKIKVENSNEEKWVLLISVNPGAPNGGSGTQYFVGDFDGKNFKTNQKDTKWLDNGADNYAGITYNDAPENKRIFIGWMSNWLYARNTPTKNWRSAMTLPREILLSKINNNYILKNAPVSQLKLQFEHHFSKDLIVLKPKQKTTLNYDNLNQSQIQFRADAKNLKLVFSNDVNDTLVLNYDGKQKTFSIDRRHSGIVNFEPSFGKSIHTTATPNIISETIDYQIILDWSSIEIFLNGGVYSFTEQIFPEKPYTKLTIQSDENQEIKNISIYKIKGIW